MPSKIFSPSVNFLVCSILFVVLPSEHDAIVTVPYCSSLGIFCFPMVASPCLLLMSNSLVQGDKELPWRQIEL